MNTVVKQFDRFTIFDITASSHRAISTYPRISKSSNRPFNTGSIPGSSNGTPRRSIPEPGRPRLPMSRLPDVRSSIKHHVGAMLDSASFTTLSLAESALCILHLHAVMPAQDPGLQTGSRANRCSLRPLKCTLTQYSHGTANAHDELYGRKNAAGAGCAATDTAAAPPRTRQVCTSMFSTRLCLGMKPLSIL